MRAVTLSDREYNAIMTYFAIHTTDCEVTAARYADFYRAYIVPHNTIVRYAA